VQCIRVGLHAKLGDRIEGEVVVDELTQIGKFGRQPGVRLVDV
jgi:hypothetical protein